MINIVKAEKALSLPTKKWKGNCHFIACLFVEKKLVKGRAVYGHWLGAVSPKSFFANRQKMPFQQHGWIKDGNGKIIDPTRWVFEAKQPYIFVDKNNGEYDEGGNKFRMANIGKAPAYNKNEKQYNLPLTTKARLFLSDLFSDNGLIQILSFGQVFWLLNHSPASLGSHCKEIYKWAKRNKLSALVPIDNWKAVMKK